MPEATPDGGARTRTEPTFTVHPMPTQEICPT